MFGEYQALQAIAPGETLNQTFAMFMGTTGEMAGDTDIDRAVGAARHDINPSAWHVLLILGRRASGNAGAGWPGQARP